MDRNQVFSIHEFKNWLSKQSDMKDFFDFSGKASGNKSHDELIGCEVYAKVGAKKIMERIEPEDGEAEILAEDLVENGGMIRSIEGKNLFVEVETGSFYIPRFCVRIVKPD